MHPDTTIVSDSFLSSTETIIGIIAAVIGILVIFFTKFLPWFKTYLNKHSLAKRFGADLYPQGVIEQSIRYYIEPYSQSVDPGGGEEPRLVYSARQKIFEATDQALNHPTEYRYLILLADSGMGKTSFLLNYYARNLRRWRVKLNLELLPLGIPDVDERISRIKNAKDKILFLDALDEDTLAIVDHVERLKTLMELTRDFRKVLITCRTQFFPKDEEIPQETGIIKLGPRSAGERAQYVFHKLYLSPFTDEQVARYLKRRFSFRQRSKRKQAMELVRKIPHLSVRPMLLAHIKDLVGSEREFKYSFQLYEEMVDAWLLREEDRVEGIKAEPLRRFSECMAIDLYNNRKTRGAERIPHDELIATARTHGIPLDDWQMRGRSLLNRDAAGNYKFAHRSIMEYLYVKRFLELKPDERVKTEWTEQMQRFLMEILTDLKERKEDFPNLERADFEITREFRSTPKELSSEETKEMLSNKGLFDKYVNKSGKGIFHLYSGQEYENDEQVVYDYATGLMWQQSGSKKSMKYEDARKWIDQLNADKFAGFKDWRLPTLEEAMSLMEPQKNEHGLYNDPIFEPNQRWIWTADPVKGESRAWVVDFSDGCNNNILSNNIYVRAVRPGQSSVE